MPSWHQTCIASDTIMHAQSSAIKHMLTMLLFPSLFSAQGSLSYSYCLIQSILLPSSQMRNHQSPATTLFNGPVDKAQSKKLQDTRVQAMKKQIRNSFLRDSNSKAEETEDQRRRMCLIDDWMEKKRIHTRPVPPLDSSSASSSHSTSPVFSSSGSESTKNRESCFPPIKPKQIRTTMRSPISKLDHSSLSLERMNFDDYSYCCSVSVNQETGPKPESRALNKPKLLPISPGAKLTSFINSMFTGRRERKAANPSSAADTCSSASSFTRLCFINKSPSSSTDHKPAKKSVRFYPSSIEDSVDILYRNVEHSGMSSISRRKDENLTLSVVEEGDIDDAASDASSDLFEIDHIIFAAINSNSAGIHEDELPVFETTSVNGSNRAISNGGIVF